jgi:hypothetical protein
MKNNPYAKVVQDCHELMVWLIERLDGFPKARRFTLGERLESGVLSILEDLVTAAYSQDKKTPLTHANRQLAVLRHLWRAALELKIISIGQYKHGLERMDSVGRQIGGWLYPKPKPEGQKHGADADHPG